ncbi:hypothetical protein DXM21_22570 [Agrobacterium rosae]|nr:hypothetical protein DXM21_22570 [Agrobacterium rosae]KAA3513902.1 hypothetical protein DXM25_22760 [Agrobacterium rosae]MQB50921.1 hypothetical protein [Agrobacterium rosae]
MDTTGNDRESNLGDSVSHNFKSVAPGGPAAINGFLYQFLANLAHISRATLSPSSDEDSSTVVITLEPGAGDASVLDGDHLLIEQYKTRSAGRTWSLKDVISEVLPDLLKAVPDLSDDSQASFRFVTDGRKGARYDELFRVIEKLAAEAETSVPGASLDTKVIRSFFNAPTDPSTADPLDYPSTDLAFFDHICSKLAGETDKNTEEHRKKVRRLLSGFSVKMEATDDAYIAEIDALLEVVVDYRENIAAKRRELYGILLDKSAVGNIEITPEELLSEAGLVSKPIRDRSKLARALFSAMSVAMTSLGYCRKDDVRPLLELGEKTVTLFSGGSGSGKTWALCSAAEAAMRAGLPSVIVRSKGDADKTLKSAANRLWIDGMGYDEDVSLKVVHARVQKSVIGDSVEDQSSNLPLAIIFVDNVQTVEEARELSLEIMEHGRFRLVMSVPENVGAAVSSQIGSEHSKVRSIGDFSFVQLREFLRLRDRPFNDLPDDLRKLLCKPVLARVYAQFEVSETFTPQNEYEIFENYYDQVWKLRGLVDHPDDEAMVVELLSATIDGKCEYPWDAATRTKLGINSDMRIRLERAGIIAGTDGADAEIWHDRVLNWMVAVTLRRLRRKSKIDAKHLCDIIEAMYESKHTIGGRSLGYVAMDYLWLALASPTAADLSDCTMLMRRLEGNPVQHAHMQGIYLLLVPTLGARAAKPLEQRLREMGKANAPLWQVKIVMKALVESLKVAREDAIDVSGQLLKEDSPILQDAGVALAQSVPSPVLLDRLWTVYCDRHRWLQNKEVQNEPDRDYPDLNSREDAMRALRRCGDLSPSWLDARLKHAVSRGDPLDGLAYMLVGIRPEAGSPIWSLHKAMLIEHMPKQRMRSLAYAVRRFRDQAEIPALKDWLAIEEDWMQQAAFAALCELDPDQALAVMTAGIKQGKGTTSWWARPLLFKKPDQFRNALLQILADDGEVSRTAQSAFRGVEDEIDDPLWNHWLGELTIKVRGIIEGERYRHPNDFYSPFSFVLSVTRHDHLLALQSKAGTPFEEDVYAIALGRLSLLEDIKGHDDVTTDAVELLRRISGKRYEDLVLAALCHPDSAARWIGLSQAAAHPSEAVTAAVRRVASEAVAGSSNGTSEDEWILAVEILDYRGDYDGIDVAAIKSGRQIPFWLAASRSQTAVAISIPQPGVLSDPISAAIALRQLISSGSAEAFDFITANLKDIDPVLPVADLVAASLSRRGEQSAEFVHFLASMLACGKSNCKAAVNALLVVNTPVAIETILSHFRHEANVAEDLEFTWDVFLILLRTDKHHEVSARLRDWIGQNRLPHSFAYLEFLPEIGTERAHDMLLDYALTPLPYRPDRRAAALKGLWKLDREAALEAASIALTEGTPRWRREIVELIITLDPEIGTERLCTHMKVEKSNVVRAAIARALRRAPKDKLVDIVETMFSSTDVSDRVAACEIAGFGGPDFLLLHVHKILDDEIEDSIRKAAFAALWRKRAEKHTLDLLAAVREAPAPQRRSLFTALLRRIDPFLSETPGDQLCLKQLSLEKWEGFAAQRSLNSRRNAEREEMR